MLTALIRRPASTPSGLLPDWRKVRARTTPEPYMADSFKRGNVSAVGGLDDNDAESTRPKFQKARDSSIDIGSSSDERERAQPGTDLDMHFEVQSSFYLLLYIY